jgi:hypothetical protein
MINVLDHEFDQGDCDVGRESGTLFKAKGEGRTHDYMHLPSKRLLTFHTRFWRELAPLPKDPNQEGAKHAWSERCIEEPP